MTKQTHSEPSCPKDALKPHKSAGTPECHSGKHHASHVNKFIPGAE